MWICTLTGWWDRLVGFKQNIGFMAQGEQRVLDKAGRVYPFKDPSQHVLVCTDITPPPSPFPRATTFKSFTFVPLSPL